MPGHMLIPIFYLGVGPVIFILTLKIVESIRIFYSDTDDLISEQLLCPRLQSGQFKSHQLWLSRPYGQSLDSSYIILEDLTSSYKCQGQSCPLPPCEFKVRSSTYNLSNPVDSRRPHPSRGELIGAFRSMYKWFPSYYFRRGISRISACWNNFIQLKLDDIKPVPSPQEICQVPTRINPISPKEMASLPRDRVEKVQAILWNIPNQYTFLKTLALSFNHEFNVTDERTKKGFIFSGYIHLIFMFNSSEGGCYIRLEHYEIFPKNTNNCSTTPTECNLLSCAKLHLLESKIRKFYRWEKQLDNASPFEEDNIDMGPHWNKMGTGYQNQNTSRSSYKNSLNKTKNYGFGVHISEAHLKELIISRNYGNTNRRSSDEASPFLKVVLVCILLSVARGFCRAGWESFKERLNYEANEDLIPNSHILNPIVLVTQSPGDDLILDIHEYLEDPTGVSRVVERSNDLNEDILDIQGHQEDPVSPDSPTCQVDDAPPAYDSVQFNEDQLPSYVEAVGLKK